MGALAIGGLLSYQFGDGDLMGPVGGLMAGALYSVFGMAAYLVALGVIGLGVKALVGDDVDIGAIEGLGFCGATIAGCILLHVSFPEHRVHGFTVGGLLGEILGEIGLGLFGVAGTYILGLAVLCVGLLASTPLTLDHLIYGANLCARGAAATGVYLWTFTVSVYRAIRERGETDESWDEEALLDETLETSSDEVDEDEEEEEEEEAVEAKPKRRKRARKKPAASASDESEARGRKKPVQAGEAPRPNRKLDELPEIVVRGRDGAPIDESAEAPKAEAKAEDKPRPSKRRGKRSATDEIEIGVREDTPGKDPSAQTEADDDDDLEAPAGKPGKKAPPRAAELAARAQKAPEPAPIREEQKPIPGIIRLTRGEYQLPPSKLFEAEDAGGGVEVDKGFVLEQAERIEHALAQFRIHGKVTKIHPGPVITRYEFKPEPGVKLSKIESLENDLAMALEAIRIRILAPIPGKATVGFEVPNKSRELVYLKEILDGDAFGKGRAFKLPMALGKNITGKAISIDLAKAPHLLVAGATGSGKSVGVNSMICSLLFSCSPEDVRMIMIDPKMLELSIYKDIPHLLQPVITDADQANLALRWAVDEMERRYSVLSDAQVRDINGYNRKLPRLIDEWEAEKRALEEASQAAAEAAREDGENAAVGSELPGILIDAAGGQTPVSHTQFEIEAKLGDRPEKMPFIVVIIDEFADLMMVASKEVEASVARLAAKARAAGIHVIVATQRPSVDVITGTIKNNFPSRIAFQVTSDIDSRTILDQKGAKQLLGMGDMLYMDRGTQPQRVHGCFVSEDEILKVVEFIKKQAKPVYNHQITAKRDDSEPDDRPDRRVDPLYDRAVQIVAETQKVSTSMIQRRLNIGYNRAAKIVEMMEEEGVIGPARGTTPREVLIGVL
ncbi:MAG: DNA translocase FtsK 4TM domain-containing protein [Myxococcales bacterium]|nr:DNA translocase FtsK 4TM domain-containing protein [Myxococcales bacterium]